jgi:general secretion pathway protein C
MKRWPGLASFLLFAALCASVAFWTMQFLKPPLRPVAATQQLAKIDYPLEAASGLFGGRKIASAAVATNYALKGVVVSRNPRDSVAILATDGKPAQAIRLGSDVVRGVTVKEVHAQYVLLSEGGVQKRVQLSESAAPQVNLTAPNNTPAQIQSKPITPSPGVVTLAPPPSPAEVHRSRSRRSARTGDTGE